MRKELRGFRSRKPSTARKWGIPLLPQPQPQLIYGKLARAPAQGADGSSHGCSMRFLSPIPRSFNGSLWQPPTTSFSRCPHPRPSPGPFSEDRPLPRVGNGRVSSRKGLPSNTSVRGRESHQVSCSGAERPYALSDPSPTGRLPRQSLRAWKHVPPLLLAVAGAGSTEPRGCKLGRNNHLCQSPFLSRGQTKGTPPCSPPGGEACGGNRETHHCDPGSSAEFPTLGSGGGGWAGAGGVEERPTERERQILRKTEGEETNRGANS